MGSVAIVGSRDFPKHGLDLVRERVRLLAKEDPNLIIVSGGARGVDLTAEEQAKALGLEVVSFRPHGSGSSFGIHRYHFKGFDLLGVSYHPDLWTTYGAAAYARNRLIVEESDKCYAFTIGSRGTANTIRIAEDASKEMIVQRVRDL